MKPDPIHTADFEADAITKFMDDWAQAVENGWDFVLRPTCCLNRELAAWFVIHEQTGAFDLIVAPAPVPDPPTEHPLWQPNK